MTYLPCCSHFTQNDNLGMVRDDVPSTRRILIGTLDEQGLEWKFASRIDVYSVIERFPIECRKTNKKVVTLVNHKWKQRNEPIRIQSKYM